MNALAKKVTDKEIADEKAAYERDFVNNLACGDAEVLDKAIKAALAVRKGVEEKGLDAFSVNFLDITKKNLDSMPFVEACKAMARGIGYAGEGDVLTASFVGALLKAFKETSFIEIFCPDWKKDKLLISHMGEMNYAVANAKPVLIRSPFIYTDAADAVKAVAEFKTGAAVFGNVYKDEDGKYKLLLSEIEMVEGEPGFESSIRGWFKANKPINEFLEELSEYGAIHHSFMVYGVDIKALEYFGKLVGLGVNKI
jgi:L-arabinose isomerase